MHVHAHVHVHVHGHVLVHGHGHVACTYMNMCMSMCMYCLEEHDFMCICSVLMSMNVRVCLISGNAGPADDFLRAARFFFLAQLKPVCKFVYANHQKG